MQCPRCHTWFCWVCLSNAKGQKHFKENTKCYSLDGAFQPEELTKEMKDKHMGVNYTNLRFCAKCPQCDTINEKKTKVNALNCQSCSKEFCYICNKAISGISHYQGAKSICHYESDHWNDL